MSDEATVDIVQALEEVIAMATLYHEDAYQSLEASERDEVCLDAVEKWFEGFKQSQLGNSTGICKICGETVRQSGYRIHLEGHNPNARGMEWQCVEEQFE